MVRKEKFLIGLKISELSTVTAFLSCKCKYDYCHAVRQEKRTLEIEAKPCHQTVWTERMSIELFLFLFLLYNTYRIDY